MLLHSTFMDVYASVSVCCCAFGSAGAEVRRVQINSKFTHEVVRVQDRVYVCDTGNGRILELEFPSMKEVRGG